MVAHCMSIQAARSRSEEACSAIATHAMREQAVLHVEGLSTCSAVPF